MKIAMVQLNILWEDKNSNLAKAELFIEQAAREKCDLAVFPEMFNTGFSMDVSAVVEAEDGKTGLFLSGLAKSYGINIAAGFAVRRTGEAKGRNTAAAYGRKGELLTSYTKIHPFSFANEDLYYTPGTDTVIFNIDGVPCSIFICYDLRFPEIFRKVAPEVKMIFVPANWPSERKEHWETLLKARAIENLCFIIGVNRTGRDGNGISYPGASQVFGPLGADICKGGETDELVICEVNPEEVSVVRSKFPFLKDMRCQ